MKHPLIITTPRTGSQILCDYLGNYSRQALKGKGTLYELFTITHLYKTDYKLNYGFITPSNYQRVNYEWCDNPREERLYRLELLKKSPDYVIKLFPCDVEPEILNFIKDQYDIVFLERKNTISQLLSFLGLVQSNVSHHTEYHKKTTEIKKIKYSRQTLIYLNQLMNSYISLKKRFNGRTIIYEDFIQSENPEKTALEILGYNIPENYQYKKINTIPTPYIGNPEDIIENREEWEKDKNLIIELLS